MGATTITRRRALVLAAATGVGSLLTRPLEAFARTPSSRPRGFGMVVSPAQFEGRASRVLRAPRRFDLVGVRNAAAVGLEVRVRRAGGAWSRWAPFAAHGDHAPDTKGYPRHGERPSDPIWAGGCDELQLRARRAPRGSLRLHFVAVPARAGRRRGVARQAQVEASPGTPPPIIPRAAWGGDGVKPRSAAEYGVVEAAFVHHTATLNGYTPDQSAGIVLGIAKYHRDTNGWNDLGYNFVVDQYGQVFEGRAGGVELPVVGAHAQGYNSRSTGVAVLGDFTGAPISEAAMAALARLLGWKLSVHAIPCEGQVVLASGGGSMNRYPKGTQVTFERISGHRDGDQTTCPGDGLYAQLPELRRRAAALAGPIVRNGEITLRAPVAAVPFGADAVFVGAVVRPDSTAGAGEAVALQKRGSTGRWVTVARTTANVDGSWAVRLPWRRGGDVRARSAGVTSPVTRVPVAPLLSTRSPRKRVPAGGRVSLSGRVRPAVPVSIVVERQGSDGQFRPIAYVRTRRSATTWRASIRLRRAGLYRLTARTTRADGGSRGRQIYVRAVHRTGGAAAV